MRLTIGLAVSAAALWLVISQMEWHKVKAALMGADLRFVALAALIYPLRLLIISQRWGALLALYAPPPAFMARLRATAIGYLANNVLPFRSGEVIRGGIIVRQGASVAAAASTLILEKILDLWALVAIALVCGGTYLQRIQALTQPLRVVSLMAAISFLAYLLAGLTCREDRLAAWAQRMPPRLAPLAGKLLRVFAESCRLLRRGPLLSVTLLATALNWTIEGTTVLLIARATGIHLPLGGALFVVAMVGLGLTLPSSPGGIGLSQYITITALHAQGVETSAATAMALLLWTFCFLSVNSIGVAFLIAQSAARREAAP